jgi:hypothetical protein
VCGNHIRASSPPQDTVHPPHLNMDSRGPPKYVSARYILRPPPDSLALAHVCRRRKLTDKDLPNSVRKHEEFSVDSQMYQDLIEMERKLDWTMMRKKVEIEDAMAKVPPVCAQTVLSWFSSTV